MLQRLLKICVPNFSLKDKKSAKNGIKGSVSPFIHLSVRSKLITAGRTWPCVDRIKQSDIINGIYAVPLWRDSEQGIIIERAISHLISVVVSCREACPAKAIDFATAGCTYGRTEEQINNISGLEFTLKPADGRVSQHKTISIC